MLDIHLYPVIEKSDTFLEFFYEALLWSFLLHPFIWTLVFISIFVSKYIVSIFSRKVIAFSVLYFVPILLISLSFTYIQLSEKLSNSLLYGTIFIIPIYAFCIIMFIQSSRLKTEFQYDEKSFIFKLQQTSSLYQIIFLVLVFLLLFCLTYTNKFTIVPHYFLIIIPFALLIYTVILYRKTKRVDKAISVNKSTDYIPLLIIIIPFFLISFFR